jgi:hypothetical protein
MTNAIEQCFIKKANHFLRKGGWAVETGNRRRPGYSLHAGILFTGPPSHKSV